MQTLNGYGVRNDANSYTPDVGTWRLARGNYNFTDDTGAQAAYTIFTVTGNVYLYGIFGVCKTLLDSGGAATIELGIEGNTAALIAQTVATELDADEIWQDAAPTANPAAVILLAHSFTVANGADIILTIDTADLTAGEIDIYTWWLPLSTNGNVLAT
jgi:outer membrane cobalamin receptor